MIETSRVQLLQVIFQIVVKKATCEIIFKNKREKLKRGREIYFYFWRKTRNTKLTVSNSITARCREFHKTQTV